MPDWSSSMQQSYEYYVVDPGTWGDKYPLDSVISSTIDRDLSVDTLGSATFDMTTVMDECYIRVYLTTIQNGVKEKHPLGTFLVQTPSISFNGKYRSISVDAYTPLTELKENAPPLGYYVPKNSNIMDKVFSITREYARAPVIDAISEEKLQEDFVSNDGDTWLIFNRDLASYAKHRYDLDEMGRILFAKEQDTASLQPVWTYTDDNSSILYSDISMSRDFYDIPNVVEVIYTNNSKQYYSKVVNDDENSPTSIQSRGRKITHRVVNPGFTGIPTKEQVDEYAKQLLRDLSTIEYTIKYAHGYCPVRIGDCVLFQHNSFGLMNVKAKVMTQSIKCTPGCVVDETAVIISKLWG